MVRAVVALGAAALCACVAAGPGPGPGSPGQGELLWDSVDVAVERYVETGATAEQLQEDLLVAAETSRGSQPARARRPRRPWANGELVTGYRKQALVSAGLGRTLRTSVRTSEERFGGFVEVVRIGAVERVVVGGVSLSAGEGLLLGNRGLAFRAPRFGRGLTSIVLRPSTAWWDRARGAGVHGRWWGGEAALAHWREPEAQTTWLVGERGGVGVAAGRHQDTSSPEAPASTMALVFARRVFPSGVVAAEVASAGGHLFTVVRTANTASDRWSAEVYNGPVPSGFSRAVVEPSDVGRSIRGGSAHYLLRRAPWTTRVSVFAHTQRVTHGLRRRHRVELVGRQEFGGGSWEASLRHTGEQLQGAPTDVLDTDLSLEPGRRSRLRLRWQSPPSALVGHRVEGWVTHASGERERRETGVSLRVSLRHRFARADIQASNYSLASGQTSFAIRPGVGGFETVTPVSGGGSDVSCRGSLHLGSRASLAAYLGIPWRKPLRAYISMRLSV